MKPRIIFTCFIAIYGIYLTATSILGGAMGISWLWFRFRHGEGNEMITVQLVSSLVPVIIGLAVLVLSRWLGAISAKIAGLGDDAPWDIHFGALELLTVLLATTGIYILAKEVGPLARQLFLLFEIKAGGHAISDKAVERLPDETQIIATALCAVAGLLIAKESRRVASVILREKGQAQPPRQQ